MQDGILTADDLATLTGKTRPAAQRKCLERNRVPFRLIDGRAVVTFGAVNEWLRGEGVQPNFDALEVKR